MSEFRRAYDMLRAYVNTNLDRIGQSPEDAALEELNAIPGTYQQPGAGGSTQPVVPMPREMSPEEKLERARIILGVDDKADFEKIRRSFEKLSRRSEPRNFPEGSPEQARANELTRLVTWAYRQLTDKVSDAEKRFRSLEIE